MGSTAVCKPHDNVITSMQGSISTILRQRSEKCCVCARSLPLTGRQRIPNAGGLNEGEMERLEAALFGLLGSSLAMDDVSGKLACRLCRLSLDSLSTGEFAEMKSENVELFLGPDPRMTLECIDYVCKCLGIECPQYARDKLPKTVHAPQQGCIYISELLSLVESRCLVVGDSVVSPSVGFSDVRTLRKYLSPLLRLVGLDLLNRPGGWSAIRARRGFFFASARAVACIAGATEDKSDLPPPEHYTRDELRSDVATSW